MFFKPGLNVVHKDHIHHMSSLQAEIAYLKREIEKGRETRPPPTPPTSPIFPQAALALTNPAVSLVSSDMCKDLTAKKTKILFKESFRVYQIPQKISFIIAEWKLYAAVTSGLPCNWSNGNLWSCSLWSCVRQTVSLYTVKTRNFTEFVPNFCH